MNTVIRMLLATLKSLLVSFRNGTICVHVLPNKMLLKFNFVILSLENGFKMLPVEQFIWHFTRIHPYLKAY